MRNRDEQHGGHVAQTRPGAGGCGEHQRCRDETAQQRPRRRPEAHQVQLVQTNVARFNELGGDAASVIRALRFSAKDYLDFVVDGTYFEKHGRVLGINHQKEADRIIEQLLAELDFH